MIFFLTISKNRLKVFNIEDDYQLLYINGNPHYDYEINKADAEIKDLIHIIQEDFNLNSAEDVQFVVMNSADDLVNSIVEEALGKQLLQSYDIYPILEQIMRSLANEKKKLIVEYGVNYDGNNYFWYNKQLKRGPFNLLAYTMDDDMVINYIRCMIRK